MSDHNENDRDNGSLPGHHIFTVAVGHEMVEGSIFEGIRQLGQNSINTDNGIDVNIMMGEDDFSDESSWYDDSDDDDSDHICPMHYYNHICVYCLERFTNPDKLHKHLNKTGHYISKQISKILPLTHEKEPALIKKTPKNYNMDNYIDPITQTIALNPVVLPCGHLIGLNSLEKWRASKTPNKNKCPVCKRIIYPQQKFYVCKHVEDYINTHFKDEIKSIRERDNWFNARELLCRFQKYIVYKERELNILRTLVTEKDTKLKKLKAQIKVKVPNLKRKLILKK